MKRHMREFVAFAAAVCVLGCGLLARSEGPSTTGPATTAPTTAATKPATSEPQSQPVPKDFQAPSGGWPKDAKTGKINNVPMDGVKNDKAWFHLAVPSAYSPEKAWPLMIVLHGGPDPSGHGPDEMASFFRGGLLAQGVISVFPNAIENQLLAWNYPHESARLIAIIRQVAHTYRIDPCRIYVVGCSMGGSGSWTSGAVLHDIWAGIGPIAGWYDPDYTPPAAAPPAKWLSGVPIYCLHGQNDSNTPVSHSETAMKAMKEVGHKVLVLKDLNDLKAVGEETMVFRAVPGAEHNVLIPWQTQGSAELGRMIGWLLAHRRKTPADLPAAEKVLAQWAKDFGWSPDGPLGRYQTQTQPATQPAGPASTTKPRDVEYGPKASLKHSAKDD